jgi:hypothetical protein
MAQEYHRGKDAAPSTLRPQTGPGDHQYKGHYNFVPDKPRMNSVRIGLNAKQDAPPYLDQEQTYDERRMCDKTIKVLLCHVFISFLCRPRPFWTPVSKIKVVGIRKRFLILL